MAHEAAGMGYWEWDVEADEMFWSGKLWTLGCLEPHSCEPSYEAWIKLIHPDDREAVEQAYRKALSEGTELNVEWRLYNPEGPLRWLMSRGRHIFDKSGRAVRFVGVCMDVTSRKTMEEALRESEEKYRLIFSAERGAIVLIDVEAGKFIEVNEAAAQLWGYTREELIGTKALDVDAEPELSLPTRAAAVQLRGCSCHSGGKERRHRLSR